MVKFRRIFGGRSDDSGPETYDVEDLITLRRFDEAEARIRASLEVRPRDVYLRLKLAEVYTGTGEVEKAVDEYFEVVDCYTDDGFYDKGLALLARVQRLAPDVSETERRIERLEQTRRLSRRLEAVLETLFAGSVGGGERSATALVRARGFRANLSNSPMIERLSEEQLRRLFAEIKVVELEKGKPVAVKDQKKDELYLVAEGGVQVVARLPDGGKTVLREFLPGDVFGERALLEHQRWAATYETSRRTLLLMLDRDSFEKVLVGSSNPRGLIDALRAGGQDAWVAKSLAEIEED